MDSGDMETKSPEEELWKEEEEGEGIMGEENHWGIDENIW